MTKLEELLRKYGKPAYYATLSEGEPEQITASKFGGQPYFERGDSWPLCTKCELPQFFICQINLKECPATGFEKYFGLLSFFYCWKCFPLDSEQPGWTLMCHKDPLAEKAVHIDMPPLPQRSFLIKMIEGEGRQTKPFSFVSQCF